MRRVLDNIEELIPIGESFELQVTGLSMLPLLGRGRDTIIVRRTTPTEDIMGRIAMFRANDGHIVVHRVRSMKDGIVQLKGDGNIRGTEESPREKIIGVVEYVRHSNGNVVSCSSRWWKTKERAWLWQPQIIRRCALGIMRRCIKH